ncbi:PIN domain-containing protein [Ectothiorhodosinus mongolicus]|uniref:PIN domain-containing protein n=1 Tax=Ectothiorhodosinus mongolicus TaxID=233100 RepID=UPI003B82DE35
MTGLEAPTLPQTPPCQDPADIPFLHLALAGDADALISGDKHLLALREKVSFSIITASDFLKVFSE